jgi:DNA replication and repair protein RecF
MLFSSIKTFSFRNLSDSEIFTGEKNIFLIGKNGQGKSNFLEALYYCCYGSSFRGVRDSEIANNKCNCFSVAGNTLSGELIVKFEKEKKTIQIDNKKVEDRKDII